MHSYKNNISLRKESNMGIASLVLGIVSLVCGCFLPGLQWIGSIAGLIGIILGALGRKNSEKKGIATAGLVCSIIGFVLSTIFYVACVACASSGQVFSMVSIDSDSEILVICAVGDCNVVRPL